MDNEKKTLIELITKNLVEIKRKKRPKNKRQNNNKNESRHPISSLLINLKINEAMFETKEESEEENFEETVDEPDEESKETINGGYGTINKHYGTSPTVKYVSYDKIWGHLGNFKSQGMYENPEDSNGIVMTSGESSRQMVSERTMDMGARNFKYFGNNNIDNTAQDMMTITSLVVPPGAGVDSVEWEKYMLMMKMSIYQPILKLKFKFA